MSEVHFGSRELKSYEDALDAVIRRAARMEGRNRVLRTQVALDFIADLWGMDSTRVEGDFTALVRGIASHPR